MENTMEAKKPISEMTEKEILRKQLELLAEQSVDAPLVTLVDTVFPMLSLVEALRKLSSLEPIVGGDIHHVHEPLSIGGHKTEVYSV